jgi:hypothetical protein
MVGPISVVVEDATVTHDRPDCDASLQRRGSLHEIAMPNVKPQNYSRKQVIPQAEQGLRLTVPNTGARIAIRPAAINGGAWQAVDTIGNPNWRIAACR